MTPPAVIGRSDPPTAELAVDDLIEFLLPDGRGRIAVLKAYFDESERDAGVYCVAGYLFEPSQAKSFAIKVQKEFGQYGGMHMTDLVARQGGYLGISADERDRLVKRAAELVRTHITAGVAVSCWTQDVKNFSPDWIRGFGCAYSICCHLCACGLGGWLRRRYPGGSGGVAYVFENNDEHAGEAGFLLGQAALHPEIAAYYQYRSHAFFSKADAPQLGAADFLAWEWTKYWDETVANPKRLMRKSLAAVLGDGWDRGAGSNPKYRLAHAGGEVFREFLNTVTTLGISQLQEDQQAAQRLESAKIQSPNEPGPEE